MTDNVTVKLPYEVSATTLPLAVETFIQEYVICGNVGRAYRAAFGETRSKEPTRSGRDLLARPDVRTRLREHQHAIASMSVKSAETLTRELEEIVEADVSELVEIKIGACRYCWGVGGSYQWRDAAELEDAITRAIEMRKPTPEAAGGFGYRFNAGVNPECQKCEGEGIQRIRLNDSDSLSPGARRLYKGLECNSDGSIKKVLLHDQLAARQELHRIRGMHIERSLSVNVTGQLPSVKDIAGNADKVNDYIEGLKKV